MTELLLKLLGTRVEDALSVTNTSLALRGGVALPWIVLAALVLGVLTWWSYAATPQVISRPRKFLLTALRLVFFALVLGLLMRPILALTVEGSIRRSLVMLIDDTASIVRCIEAGAEDFLPKPFDPVILRARIASGLNRKRLGDLEQTRVRDVFARFLPEPIAAEILARSGGQPSIGAVRLWATVMFIDLRGFTTFAESQPVEQVIVQHSASPTQVSPSSLQTKAPQVPSS